MKDTAKPIDTEDIPPYADMVNAGLIHMIPAAAQMGVQVTEAGRGYAATTVPLEGNSNHFGTMYAGVLFTVSEIIGGALAVATFDMAEHYPVVKDLHIFFKKPARTQVWASAGLPEDEIVRITTEAAANGKAEFVLEAEITDADGNAVAVTTGLYQLRGR